MSVRVYRDYSPDRPGWYFGLTGIQLITLVAAGLPVLWAVQIRSWTAIGATLGILAAVVVFTIVPIRGRSTAGWVAASVLSLIGAITGAARFRARATTATNVDGQVDLPGVLQAIQVHDGPPTGPHARRVAVIQHHGLRYWAITATVTHPGIGMTEPHERDRWAAGLADLVDAAQRTELIDELQFLIRTVPDDGAERTAWLSAHRSSDGPDLARRVNDDLQATLTPVSVRTESYVTLVVPEGRLARPAREAGRGVDGRARILGHLAAELETHLRNGLGMTAVTWLTSPELAIVCRTGFAPGDRASIVDATSAQRTDSAVNTGVPWDLAGPSGTETLARSYRHDAWQSTSSTLRLPARGAQLGALAPVITPAEPGERRSLLVAIPVLSAGSATRRTDNAEFAADIAAGLRTKAGVRERATARDQAAKARAMDAKLATGHAMTRPHAICTITTPATSSAADAGRRLDASCRRAGLAPLRLDLAQDAAFAATAAPLGVSLTRRSTT